jgi:ADP-ribose pyrophosphatase YjhB (NUDIX family)
VSDQKTDTQNAWLSPEDIAQVRNQVPIIYVDAVPVRVNPDGEVTHIGMLLRQAADGSNSRMVVSGRVMMNERIRDALMRHLEKDLGPLALPRVPPEPAPFTVIEYFQDPSVSGFYDPRHHAVSLAYVVPVTENVLLSCENEKAANPILRVSVAGSPKFAVPPAKLVEELKVLNSNPALLPTAVLPAIFAILEHARG